MATDQKQSFREIYSPNTSHTHIYATRSLFEYVLPFVDVFSSIDRPAYVAVPIPIGLGTIASGSRCE